MTETIHYIIEDTALGLAIMAASDKGVCCLEFGDSKDQLRTRMKTEFPEPRFDLVNANGHADLFTWGNALVVFLETGAGLPDIPLDIRGTDFEKQVWNALRTIPEGQVAGYSQLAEKVGRAGAARAVGSACGRNRIAILIPCHRILRGDGQLGGYRWGLPRKQALLRIERQQHFDASLTIAAV